MQQSSDNFPRKQKKNHSKIIAPGKCIYLQHQVSLVKVLCDKIRLNQKQKLSTYTFNYLMISTLYSVQGHMALKSTIHCVQYI